MILVFNDDGIKLATLILKQTDVGVFLLPDSMKVTANLGGLSLYDEVNEGAARESSVRKLISIEGDDLAELYYETFDPTINTEPYSSLVKFKTGSMVVRFVEDAFSRISGYLSQFQRMKYIYDRAREAALNRANNIEGANQMKFDLLIRAPILIFPSPHDPSKNLYDTITVNLGEIYSTNNFVTENGLLLNMIDAGIRNTKVSSSFIKQDSQKQELEIIDQMDVWFKINYCDSSDVKRPSSIITGGVTGKEMKLNELQAKYLMNLIRTVPGVFSGSSSNESFDEIATDATKANKIISGKVRNPIPVAEQAVDSSPESMSRVSLDLDFNIPLLALTLFNDNSASIDQDALSRFSLNDMGIKFEMKRNGDFKSDLHIKSFVVQDIRETKDNRFSYIIPEVSPTDYQFMASAISTRNGESTDFDINLAIDSPKVILALDYLMALQSYLNVALFQDQSSHVHDHILATIDEVVEEDDTQTLSPSVTNYSYKVNVVDPSVILLADPHKDDRCWNVLV
ncbi:unnamed protein product [Ambrosiozyma monospora]|uniref:Unnamed protein product n=1 Tax=Ambrosiozyma monospora TaxID=43982 RepID=A0ACB5TBA4_AMBMO|nr:unnamed protein product [Ambrosiozyma monospora]